jgi:hypothetical protein
VSRVEEFKKLESFIFENELHIYKVLVIDYRHHLHMDVADPRYQVRRILSSYASAQP